MQQFTMLRMHSLRSCRVAVQIDRLLCDEAFRPQALSVIPIKATCSGTRIDVRGFSFGKAKNGVSESHLVVSTTCVGRVAVDV